MQRESLVMIARKLAFAALAPVALLAGVATPAIGQEDSPTGEMTVQEQLEALLDQGKQQLDAGEGEAAVTTLSTVVNALEQSNAYLPGPYVLRAKAYAQIEEYEAAIDDLKKAIQYAATQPAILPEVQNTRAEVYMELGAYQLALPDLQAAVNAARANRQYQFNYGKTLVNLGGFDQAEKALTRYLDAGVEGQEEQRAEAFQLRASANGSLRDFDAAREDIAASLAIEPDAHEPYFVRARIALVEENYAAAIADLGEAIARYEPVDEDDDAPYIEAMLIRASAYEEIGKQRLEAGDDESANEAFAGCVSQCDELLAGAEEDDARFRGARSAALFRRGVAQRLSGELGDAVKSFSRALEIDPNLGEAYFRRGICFHFLGEEKLAIRDFETAASINFDSPRSNLWKGMSWAKIGDYDQAIRAYGESIAVSDRYTPAFVNRSLAHLAQGDHERAISDLNEAIRLEPTEALHYYRRGRAYLLAGEREKAIRSFMNSIEFDSELRPAYTALIRALEANGQSALAGEYRNRMGQLGL